MPPIPDVETVEALKKQLRQWWELVADEAVPIDLELDEGLGFSLADVISDWEERGGFLLPMWWPFMKEDDEVATSFEQAWYFRDLLEGTMSDADRVDPTALRERLLIEIAQQRYASENDTVPRIPNSVE
jgi:hypothetical protein